MHITSKCHFVLKCLVWLNKGKTMLNYSPLKFLIYIFFFLYMNTRPYKKNTFILYIHLFMKIKVTIWKPNPSDRLKKSQIRHIVWKWRKRKSLMTAVWNEPCYYSMHCRLRTRSLLISLIIIHACNARFNRTKCCIYSTCSEQPCKVSSCSMQHYWHAERTGHPLGLCM